MWTEQRLELLHSQNRVEHGVWCRVEHGVKFFFFRIRLLMTASNNRALFVRDCSRIRICFLTNLWELPLRTPLWKSHNTSSPIFSIDLDLGKLDFKNRFKSWHIWRACETAELIEMQLIIKFRINRKSRFNGSVWAKSSILHTLHEYVGGFGQSSWLG